MSLIHINYILLILFFINYLSQWLSPRVIILKFIKQVHPYLFITFLNSTLSYPSSAFISYTEIDLSMLQLIFPQTSDYIYFSSNFSYFIKKMKAIRWIYPHIPNIICKKLVSLLSFSAFPLVTMEYFHVLINDKFFSLSLISPILILSKTSSLCELSVPTHGQSLLYNIL